MGYVLDILVYTMLCSAGQQTAICLISTRNKFSNQLRMQSLHDKIRNPLIYRHKYIVLGM